MSTTTSTCSSELHFISRLAFVHHSGSPFAVLLPTNSVCEQFAPCSSVKACSPATRQSSNVQTLTQPIHAAVGSSIAYLSRPEQVCPYQGICNCHVLTCPACVALKLCIHHNAFSLRIQPFTNLETLSPMPSTDWFGGYAVPQEPAHHSRQQGPHGGGGHREPAEQ